MISRLKYWAKQFKRQIYVLYLANKDSRVPIYAKIFTACVVAYAFSPIDLVPDFIPILGFLDELILLPLGIYIALKLIPKEIVEEYTIRAQWLNKRFKKINWIAGILIIALWILFIIWLVIMLQKLDWRWLLIARIL